MECHKTATPNDCEVTEYMYVPCHYSSIFPLSRLQSATLGSLESRRVKRRHHHPSLAPPTPTFDKSRTRKGGTTNLASPQSARSTRKHSPAAPALQPTSTYIVLIAQVVYLSPTSHFATTPSDSTPLNIEHQKRTTCLATTAPAALRLHKAVTANLVCHLHRLVDITC